MAIAGGAVVITLAAVVLIAGRGGDGSTEAAVDPGPTATDPGGARADRVGPASPGRGPGMPRAEADLTVAELEAALLNPEDLGMTEEGDARPDSTDTLPFEAFDSDAACLDELARFEADGTRPRFGGGPREAPRQAKVELTGYQATMEHELADGLDVTVADYRALFETCGQISFSGQGHSGALTISPGPALDLGDDSLSLQYTFGTGGPRGTPVLWVLWERDSIVASLNVSGGGPDAPYLLQDGASVADARLADALR